MLGPALSQLLAHLQQAESRTPYADAVLQELTALREAGARLLASGPASGFRRWGIWLDRQTSPDELARIRSDAPFGPLLAEQPMLGGGALTGQWRLGAWRAEESGQQETEFLGLHAELQDTIRTEGYTIQLAPPWHQSFEDALLAEDRAWGNVSKSCGKPDCPFSR